MVNRENGSAVKNETPRARRFARPYLLAFTFLLFIALLAGSFLVGTFVNQPVKRALEQAQQNIPVTAEVRTGIVNATPAFNGKIEAGSTQMLVVAADPPVVTRAAPAAGSTIQAGAFLGSVGGVPYFALLGPVPTFRDLPVDATGDDVFALRAALRTSGFSIAEKGPVDRLMLRVIQRFFTNAGYPLPTVIPGKQLVSLHGTGTVVTAAPLGSIVSKDNPLLTIRVGENRVAVRVDEIAAGNLAVGGKFSGAINGTAMNFTITEIGNFSSGDSTKLAGRTVHLETDDPEFQKLPVDTLVQLRQEVEAQETLTVPLTAVRRDANGDYVLRLNGGKQERVGITVLRTGDGQAAIQDGTLQAGDSVLVS
ncbi:MAG: hypothetical protein B5766_07335 [Candidatus Lumbricidophila eiseniae]|uniref:PDZ domain-containing protein n=1 Tax=Candidatus Lumbricidiphila eiseniae TaxID=1969409 RepID=A0A2A6FR22_9MICO|nr:MAG: hypothetical protein B5766_07335 [Candidatus Lumbricidophila eiseniae]